MPELSSFNSEQQGVAYITSSRLPWTSDWNLLAIGTAMAR